MHEPGRSRLPEATGVDLGWFRERGDAPLDFFELSQLFSSPFGFFRRVQGKVVTGSGFGFFRLYGKPVVRVGQQEPLARLEASLDTVLRRKAVLVASRPVAPPLNAINGGRLGQFQLNPSLSFLVGDPTVVVAVFAVVEVNELVLGVVGVVSRGGRLGPRRRVAGILSTCLLYTSPSPRD